MTSPALLSVRIRFHDDARLGPGKVALLEALQRTGSVKAAGAAMDMSARRAWLLLESLNKAFDEPVVTTDNTNTDATDPDAGEAQLTDLGQQLIAAYRAVEADTERSVSERFATLVGRLRQR